MYKQTRDVLCNNKNEVERFFRNDKTAETNESGGTINSTEEQQRNKMKYL
jgi:hypothetical protein